jgi:hypothetical protein
LKEVLVEHLADPAMQHCIKGHYLEEEQTTQWPKEKGQQDKQRSTKHT